MRADGIQAITGWEGGFDVVLGNPPWERIKLQEKEWFAERAPEIAAAPNAAARKRLITALEQERPQVYANFLADLRTAAGESQLIRASNRYPLSGVGDINTYAVFTETARTIIAANGYAGVVIPTGIATDDSLKHFFDDLIQTNSLALLVGFENEEFIFAGIANVVRFCIFVMTGTDIISDAPSFAFYLRQLSQIEEKERFFQVTAKDIALLNPNTLTSPIFRNRVDATLTKAIYERIPILENEATSQSDWGVRFTTLFHMASDSGLFADSALPETVPLYEAKFFWHYDHRFGSYELKGIDKGKGGRGLPNQRLANYLNPHYKIEPRYWIPESEFKSRVPATWDYEWFIGFRDVTSAKLERSAVFSLIPFVAVGHKAPLIFPYSAPSVSHIACFLANMNSLILDFIVRQKIGGTSMSYFIIKQLPVLPPDYYTNEDVEFISSRVLELVYTAWDIQAFALDMNYQGEPFVWDESRREILRAELDAYYAKLYGLSRDELRYILDPTDIYGEAFAGETFRVLKEKELGLYGEYRTQRLVLEAWDRMFE